jgi:Uma2 family endonuclease
MRIQTLFETPAKERMSSAQYIASPQSECKSDLIEGVFVMASPASRRHESLVSFIDTTLRNFVAHYNLGEVTSSNAAYVLNEDNVYQPDISFVSRERLHLATTVYFPGAPDIAVEVVSPASRQYDLVEKKINYGRFGVREYWLIDPMDERAIFYTQIDGQLLPISAPEGIVRSQLLDGFWLRIEWLFPAEHEQHPSPLEVARQQGLI